MKIRKLFLLLTIIVLTITACTPGTDNPSTDKTVPQEPQGPFEGGVARVGLNLEGVNIDPLRYFPGSSSIYNIDDILYRGLLKYDDQLNIKPDLAEAFQINADQKTITITLKKDIKFADGTPITVEDVKKTVEFYASRDYSGDWKNVTFHLLGADQFRMNKAETITGIELLPEENKMILSFDLLEAKDLQLLLAPIIAKGQLKDRNAKEIKTDSLQGLLTATGPFKLDKINENEISIVKNEHYEGKVYLDGVLFKNYSESEDYDLIFALPQHIETHSENYDVATISGSGYQYLGMNLENEQLKDANLRKAIADVLDTDKLITASYNDQASKTVTMIHPKSWAYANIILNNDIESAKAFLNNKQLQFELVYEDNKLMESIANEVKAQLATFGVTIDLTPIEADKYVTQLFSKGAKDLFLASWPYEMDPAFENYKWLSSQDVILGGYNVSRLKDEKIDNLLISAASTLDPVKRKNLYGDFQDYFMNNHFIIPLASPDLIVLIKKGSSFEINNVLTAYNSIEEWWVMPEEKSEAPEEK